MTAQSCKTIKKVLPPGRDQTSERPPASLQMKEDISRCSLPFNQISARFFPRRDRFVCYTSRRRSLALFFLLPRYARRFISLEFSGRRFILQNGEASRRPNQGEILFKFHKKLSSRAPLSVFFSSFWKIINYAALDPLQR